MSESINSPKTSILKAIVATILPVMLGVFLGLWANNWNEGRKSKSLETEVIQKIAQDIKANKQQLEEVFDYHKSLSDSTHMYYREMSNQDLEKSFFDFMSGGEGFFWRGTRTAPLRDAGYQTAVVSGVLAKLDFKMVALLSEVNQAQKNYEKLSSMYTESAINKTSQMKVVDYLSFAEFFSYDISAIEEKLINLYDITLKELEK